MENNLEKIREDYYKRFNFLNWATPNKVGIDSIADFFLSRFEEVLKQLEQRIIDATMNDPHQGVFVDS